MSDSTRKARALKALEDTIQQLGALRNAGSRDPGFREWRQNSLTLVQRLWPGDTTRSERFRRIPFSPPSTQADVKTTREVFERGCAEALAYLRTLAADVEHGNFAGSTGTRQVRETTVDTSDFPTVELLPTGEPLDIESAPEKAAAQEPPVDTRMLPSEAEARSQAAPARPPEAAPRPSEPEPMDEIRLRPTPMRELRKAVEAGRKSGSAPAPKPPQRRSPRGRGRDGQHLKEMLGLDRFEKPTPTSTPRPALEPQTPAEPAEAPLPALGAVPPGLQASPPEAPAPAATPAPVVPTPDPDFIELEPHRAHVPATPTLLPVELAQTSAVERPRPAPPAPPPSRIEEPEPADEPELIEELADEPEPLDDPEPVDDPEPLEEPAEEPHESPQFSAAEFMRNSPVLSAQGRPLERRHSIHRDERRPSPVAEAVRVLARQVTDLGVPDGRRAQMRALLLNLASELDQPTPSWEAMAETIGASLDFPALACALLPLLSSELERAA